MASFLQVSVIELPVLVGIVEPRQETISLLITRHVQPELEDYGTVASKVFLMVANRLQSLIPNGFHIDRVRQLLGFENFRVHANNQHLFVVTAVENADANLISPLAGKKFKILIPIAAESNRWPIALSMLPSRGW